MADTGNVRNRAKIAATIDNAGCMAELVKAEGSLAAFVSRFEPKPEDLAEPFACAKSAKSGASASFGAKVRCSFGLFWPKIAIGPISTFDGISRPYGRKTAETEDTKAN